MKELVGDGFAGGGGASEGLTLAGLPPHFAINHDAMALAMHEANHPGTKHYRSDIYEIDPEEATGGRPMGLLWLSPNCTHFSRAKGGKPKSAKIRSLASVGVRWARAVKPRVIIVENVPEFKTWGPLLANGKPCPKRKGKSFRTWVRQLERAGYAVEWRELQAHHYGAPTSRKRLFVVARCDGEPIVWPEPTHGPGLVPYRTASECIDWTTPVRSIFDRKKPLADKTLARIARAIQKHVLDAQHPVLVPEGAAALIQTSYGERKGQAPRVLDLKKPLGTVVAGGQKHGLVYACIAKHYGGHEGTGASLRAPLSTITTQDHHSLLTVEVNGPRRAQVRAFLERFGVDPKGLEITDIGMRMLTPRELFRAQGFRDDYVIDPTFEGKALSITAQVRMCGNSVCPPLAAAIARANMHRPAGRLAA